MKAALIFLLISAPHARATVPSSPWDSFDRKVQISPKAPATGIETGLVIFIGHLIAPPFAFEWRGSKLFLNGVQVSPTPYNEAQQASLTASIAKFTEEEKKQNQLAYEATTKISDMARNGSSRREILSFARSQSVFENAEWESDNSLRVYQRSKGKLDSFFIWLPQKGQAKVVMSDDEKERRNAMGRAEEVKRLEDILKKGRVLVFGMLGGHGERLNSISFPSSVPKIMNDSTLGDAEKLEKLSKLNWGDEWELAKDIVANYDKTEWAIAVSTKYDGWKH